MVNQADYSDLNDMLRVCVLSWKGIWEDHLPLVEFAHKNSYHPSMWLCMVEGVCLSYVGIFREVIRWSRLDSGDNREGIRDAT